LKNTIDSVLFVILALLVQSVCAQPEDTMDNGLEDGPLEVEMARVISNQSRPEDCLAAVAINRVDGEPRVFPAQGFLIEPGLHSINGLATLDITHCSIDDKERQISTTADLEHIFEPGMTYYIGFYHRSQISDERRLVVWKTELSTPLEQFFQ
jgi:hypothetical protein